MPIHGLKVSLLTISILLGSCGTAPRQDTASEIPSSDEASQCHQRRAAFDVGSGSTKFQVAIVDVCLQKVVRSLYQGQEKVDYKEDLSRSQDKILSEGVQEQGLNAIKKFVETARAFGVHETSSIAGVATAAFREAKNGLQVLKRIEKETAIKVALISQKEEGVVGFYSALASHQVTAADRNLVVWDIGGGSSQITALDEKDFIVSESDLASVSFKNQVIREIKKRTNAQTPNPLTSQEARLAVQLAERLAAKSVAPALKRKIKSVGGKVYGIGGVHGFSIRSQIKKERYGIDDVIKGLEVQAGKTDLQIGGKFASTDVTNLALVAGYMKAAGIHEVETLKVDNTEGVLINPMFWKNGTQ